MSIPKHTLKIALGQINPVVGDVEGNFKIMRDVVARIPSDTDLVVFPELAFSGYPPEDLVRKPQFLDAVRKHVEFFVEQTRHVHAAVILPTPWAEAENVYNAALVIHDGYIIDKVFKVDLPNYGVFDEKRVFDQGPWPAEPFVFKGFKLGLMICEDMWRPEVSKTLSDKGAEMLIVINGSPFERTKTGIRTELARKRVEETGKPLIYLNMTGGQDELVFDGNSFVLSERGQVIARLPSFEDHTETLTWEKTGNGHWLCAAETPDVNQGNGSVNEYQNLFQAMVTGLRDYVLKNNFPGVLIGLSGGIDSALTAVIAVSALGKENVRCVMMPSRFTSKASLDDARRLAENLGVQYDIYPIKEPVEAFENALSITGGIAHENMQSRCRGLTLMALSNESGYMVVSTGNKSEMAVGYATLYGDMCGGYNPLKDLYKTKVYKVCRWINEHPYTKNTIPENIIKKAPTAELKDNQRDQDSLPPYSELDTILEHLVEMEKTVEDIVQQGFDRDTVLKIWSMLEKAEYKRRQAPPGVKLTVRAFGRDRRYPITNGFRSAPAG